jgi:asparagine synthase (glutamine-hydrolysing)
MNTRLAHRGPDGGDSFTDKEVSLGHRRLSILDLSDKAKQPMKYVWEKKEYYLTYNGELYNHLEVRAELEKLGHTFTSTGDSQTLLAAYAQWGKDAVKKFNGMWAFVMYDVKKKELFCSRDRIGVKPFYYSLYEGVFYFASELKAFHEIKKLNLQSKKSVNSKASQFYFSLGYIPSPYTIYREVFKLEAGHNLTFNLKTKKLKKERYYELPNYKAEKKKKSQWIKEYNELLQSSTQLRLLSDVPVGAFLSGGLDSSSVVFAMKNSTKAKNLNTFSIGFREKDYDETPGITLVKNTFKTKHHHYYFENKDLQDIQNSFVEAYDEPFWDYSGFTLLALSKQTSKKVKVVLSGDGGDELFGGYRMHLAGKRISLIKQIPKSLRKLMQKALPGKENVNSYVSLYALKHALELSLFEEKYFHARLLRDSKYLPKVAEKWIEDKTQKSLKKASGNFTEAMRLYDLLFNTLTDNFLVKTDRATMYYGLELRSPYLDYRFMEFSQRVPTTLKCNLQKGKIIIREAMKDILPKKLFKLPKQGFEPPLDQWIMKKEYLEKTEKGLERLKEEKLIDKELYDYYTQKVFKREGKFYRIARIKLYLYILWYERWIDC